VVEFDWHSGVERCQDYYHGPFVASLASNAVAAYASLISSSVYM